MPCYRADGAVTLAAHASGSVCALHARDAAQGVLWETAQDHRYAPAAAAVAGAARGGSSGSSGAVTPGVVPDGAHGAGSRGGRERAVRGPGGGSAGPGRTRRRAAEVARRRAAARARGRRRAAERIEAGGFSPHPGVEGWLPPGRCRDQAVARAWVRELLAGSGFRADRRKSWRAVLEQFVHAMDWESGLVTGCTHARVAARARCSVRSVSRAVAWATAQGLLVVAERGASAAFLKTDQGRTPTYAVYRPGALTPAPDSSAVPDTRGAVRDGADGVADGGQDGPGPDTPAGTAGARTGRVSARDGHPRTATPDRPPGAAPGMATVATGGASRGAVTSTNGLVGDLPRSTGGSYPSQAQGNRSDRAPRGLNTRPDGAKARHLDRSSNAGDAGSGVRWSLYAIPTGPGERERALDRVLQRAGIAPGSVSRRTRWALRGLLRRWWDAGLGPAAVLHALGHHPDRPGRPHGPLAAGARDLAAVAGARLAPWTGRLGELPATVIAHHAAAVQPSVAEAMAAALAAVAAVADPGGRAAAAPGAARDETRAGAAQRDAGPDQAAPTRAAGKDRVTGGEVAATNAARSAELRAELRAELAAELARRRADRADRASRAGRAGGDGGHGGRGTRPGPRRPRS